MTGNKRRGLVIQDRDRQLLAELSVMRIMDRDAARIIGRFHTVRRANRRLLLLTRAGLLRRFFVGSVAHGRKAVYTLSARGAALVSAKQGGIQRPSERLVVGDAFVEHQAGINAIYLALRYIPIPFTGVRLLRWHTFHQPISDQIKLTPDGYFEIAFLESIRAMFLEVDLGTEALSIWQQKVGSYLQLAVSGEFPKKFRQPKFRVLIVANSDRRLQNIRATVLKSTDKIFWFTTFENIHRDGLWSAVWLRPTGDQLHSLL
jgi:hypothetical protein